MVPNMASQTGISQPKRSALRIPAVKPIQLQITGIDTPPLPDENTFVPLP
jgi:hypothetical protein